MQPAARLGQGEDGEAQQERQEGGNEKARERGAGLGALDRAGPGGGVFTGRPVFGDRCASAALRLAAGPEAAAGLLLSWGADGESRLAEAKAGVTTARPGPAQPLAALRCSDFSARRSSLASRRGLRCRMRAVAAALRAGPCRPARSDSRRRAPTPIVDRHPCRRATRRRRRRLSRAAARRRARSER